MCLNKIAHWVELNLHFAFLHFWWSTEEFIAISISSSYSLLDIYFAAEDNSTKIIALMLKGSKIKMSA